MMTKEELMQGMDEATNDLADKLAAFDNDHFNRKPGPDKWSAGQLAEHLLKMDLIVIKQLSGYCTKTARDPFANKSAIHDRMSDVERGLTAPEFIKPGEVPHDRDAIISDILKQRKMVSNLILVSDITETCMESKHPGFGQMTRGEWAYFDICHSNRHLKQLERLATV